MPTALTAPPLSPPVIDAAIVERVLIHGDLRQLTPTQKISYYQSVCEAVGLNPMTQPFAYLVLNNKEILYAKREATEQLRFIHTVSIDPKNFSREVIEGIYVVTAPASLPNGRTDVSTGAVSIEGLKGEARANAMMKAETKAKRRVTLSICGLGMLDETEIETIPSAFVVEAPVLPEKHENPAAATGETRGDSLPPGAVYITKVEGPAGKAKGFLQHSGQTASLHGMDGIGIYDDKLVTLAAEVCQAREPVWLEIKTAASGKHYVKAIKRVTELTEAELAFEASRQTMARQAGEVF